MDKTMQDAGFVKIASLFSKMEERTIPELARIYGNLPELTRIIAELVHEESFVSKIAGKRILLKPNWVRHSLRATDEICLRTHDAFLLSVLDVILMFNPASVIIGDAPIQSCVWDRMISSELLKQIEYLSKRHGTPVPVKDFRRTTFEPFHNQLSIERRPLDDYMVFDMGKQSYLEPVSRADSNPFRVTSYNPDRLAESHRPGVHKYCITRELFDADIVLSLPKVKTHQKAGITAALKNLVGLNGDKDFLPHHRIGGTAMGGDCYPGGNIFRYLSELALDKANRQRGENVYRHWRKFAALLWRVSLPKSVHQMSAGWYGNDTTWRMVLDLNRIACYGKADGTLSQTPQRSIFSLCDGVIGGQGDGPLTPDPLPLGIICFTNNSYATDMCLATLMNFDYCRIPLLSAATQLVSIDSVSISLDNLPVNVEDLKLHAILTQPPPGWVNSFVSD